MLTSFWGKFLYYYTKALTVTDAALTLILTSYSNKIRQSVLRAITRNKLYETEGIFIFIFVYSCIFFMYKKQYSLHTGWRLDRPLPTQRPCPQRSGDICNW